MRRPRRRMVRSNAPSRNDGVSRPLLATTREDQPALYGAVEVKRESSQRSPLATGNVSFLVRPRVFLRPGHDFAERRAQPSSRLAGTSVARQAASCPGHALTPASPVGSLVGGAVDGDP